MTILGSLFGGGRTPDCDQTASELATLEAHRAAIEASMNALVATSASYTRADEAAGQRFFSTFNEEDLHAWIETRTQLDASRQLNYIISRQVAGGLAFQRFAESHPDWHAVLLRAAEQRIALAKVD